VEVSWLAPIEHYIELTGGVYDTIGAERLGDLNDNGFFHLLIQYFKYF